MDVENVSPSIYSFNSVHCSVPFSFKLFQMQMTMQNLVLFLKDYYTSI